MFQVKCRVYIADLLRSKTFQSMDLLQLLFVPSQATEGSWTKVSYMLFHYMYSLLQCWRL